MATKTKHQNFAVVSFIEAHPNFMEQAETCAWAEFMRETWHKYEAGKRYKPAQLTDETGELKVPPPSREVKKNPALDESGKPIPSTNISELIEDYVLWRNCNAVKMYKYYKQFYDDMPVSRALKIYGVHRYEKDAETQRNKVSADEGSDVFVVRLKDDDGEPAPFLYNPPKSLIKAQKFSNEYMDNLMSSYLENQKEADDLNERIQKIAIRKARERELERKKLGKPLDQSTADQICGVDNDVRDEPRALTEEEEKDAFAARFTRVDQYPETLTETSCFQSRDTPVTFIPIPHNTPNSVAPQNSPTEPVPELENV